MKVTYVYADRTVTVNTVSKSYQYEHKKTTITVLLDFYEAGLIYKLNIIDASGEKNESHVMTYAGTENGKHKYTSELWVENTTYAGEILMSMSIEENDNGEIVERWTGETFEKYINATPGPHNTDLDPTVDALVLDDIYAQLSAKLNTTHKGYYNTVELGVNGTTLLSYVQAIQVALLALNFEGLARVRINSAVSDADYDEIIAWVNTDNSTFASVEAYYHDQPNHYYNTYYDGTLQGWKRYLTSDDLTTINQAISEKIPLTYIDTDDTFAANSDTKIATQKAVKTNVDAIKLRLDDLEDKVVTSIAFGYTQSSGTLDLVLTFDDETTLTTSENLPLEKILDVKNNPPYFDEETGELVLTFIGDINDTTVGTQTEVRIPISAVLSGHIAQTDNPHSVTKAQVGLGNVNNTSDLEKPISTLQQTEFNKKLDKDITGYDTITPADADLIPIYDISGKIIGKTTATALASYVNAAVGSFVASGDYSASGLIAFASKVVIPTTPFTDTATYDTRITAGNTNEIVQVGGKKAKLSKVQGYSAVVSNLVTNGDFSNGTTGFTIEGTGTSAVVTDISLGGNALELITTAQTRVARFEVSSNVNDVILFVIPSYLRSYTVTANPNVIFNISDSNSYSNNIAINRTNNTTGVWLHQNYLWTNIKGNFRVAIGTLSALTRSLIIDNVRIINLTQMVELGLIATPTQQAYETWLTTQTTYKVGDYFQNINASVVANELKSIGENKLKLASAGATTNGITYDINETSVLLKGTATAQTDIEIGSMYADGTLTYKAGGLATGVTLYAGTTQITTNTTLAKGTHVVKLRVASGTSLLTTLQPYIYYNSHALNVFKPYVEEVITLPNATLRSKYDTGVMYRDYIDFESYNIVRYVHADGSLLATPTVTPFTPIDSEYVAYNYGTEVIDIDTVVKPTITTKYVRDVVTQADTNTEYINELQDKVVELESAIQDISDDLTLEINAIKDELDNIELQLWSGSQTIAEMTPTYNFPMRRQYVSTKIKVTASIGANNITGIATLNGSGVGTVTPDLFPATTYNVNSQASQMTISHGLAGDVIVTKIELVDDLQTSFDEVVDIVDEIDTVVDGLVSNVTENTTTINNVLERELLFELPFDVDVNEAYMVNADAPLTVVNYLNDLNELVHPSVLFFKDKFNGWHYWMAYTPFDEANSQNENPSIAVSNDGITWATPSGLTNPVVPQPSGNVSYFNADTHLMYDGKTLYMYYKVDDVRGVTLCVRTSTDGITWSNEIVVLAHITSEENVSPIVRYDNGKYYMWTVQSHTDPYTLVRRESTTPTGTFSNKQTCTFAVPSGRKLWHMDIVKMGDQWHCLMQDGTNFGGLGNLLFAKSYDGLLWQVSNHLLQGDVGIWDGYVYKPAIVPFIKDGKLAYKVWYTSANPRSWYMGYTELTFDKTKRLEEKRNKMVQGIYGIGEVIVVDTFNRTDNATVGNALSGQTWETGVDVDSMKIADKQLASTGISNQINVIDSGLATGIKIRAKFMTSQQGWIVFRYGGATSYYRFGKESPSASLEIQKIDGIVTSINDNLFINYAGDELSVEIVGNTYTLRVNDVFKYTFTDSFGSANTKHGLQTDSATATFDDFVIETL